MGYTTNKIPTSASTLEYDNRFSGQLVLIPHFNELDSYRRLQNRLENGHPVWVTFRADQVDGYTRPIEPGLNSAIMLAEVRFSEDSNKYFYIFVSPHYSTPVEPNTTIKIDTSSEKVEYHVEYGEAILRLPVDYKEAKFLHVKSPQSVSFEIVFSGNTEYGNFIENGHMSIREIYYDSFWYDHGNVIIKATANIGNNDVGDILIQGEDVTANRIIGDALIGYEIIPDYVCSIDNSRNQVDVKIPVIFS
jgi:hypothetical protein